MRANEVVLLREPYDTVFFFFCFLRKRKSWSSTFTSPRRELKKIHTWSLEDPLRQEKRVYKHVYILMALLKIGGRKLKQVEAFWTHDMHAVPIERRKTDGLKKRFAMECPLCFENFFCCSWDKSTKLRLGWGSAMPSCRHLNFYLRSAPPEVFWGSTYLQLNSKWSVYDLDEFALRKPPYILFRTSPIRS